MTRRKPNRPVAQTPEERAARRQRKIDRRLAGTTRGGGPHTHATGSKADRKRRDGERLMRRDRDNREENGDTNA